MTETPRTTNDIPGWFPPLDQELFGRLLDRTPGDLLELGVYLGRSAVLLGDHLRTGERLTVCDLFETGAPDAANAEEMRGSYPTLTRAAFERNYLAFHEKLPEIVQGPTSEILDHVKPGTCKFVHIDASHLYEHVRDDIVAARTVLRPDGIVACDDYRSEHTPGVAAAVWEAVSRGELRPICVSTQKLYGTWGDPAPIQAELLEWLGEHTRHWHEVQQVLGAPLIRINRPRPQPQRTMKTALEREREKHVQTLEALRRKRDQLEDVQNSVSYRVGRMLTAPPRAIRRIPRGPRP